ncbi:MAG: hypothetical protein ACP5ME_14220, partial [Anaerolineae bacterium]
MKAKALTAITLIAVLALLLSGPATAQGPRPPRPPEQPAPPQTLPPWEPELGKPFGPLPAPLAHTAGEGPGLALSAAEGVRPASIPLGQPGLSFRYVQTFGTTRQAYISDTQHLNFPLGLFMDGSDNLYITEGHGAR